MNFNSIGRSSNYAKAGAAANRQAVSIHGTTISNMSDMGKIAMNAATRKSKEKIAANEIASDVARAGIAAQGEVKADKIVKTATRARDKSKRKAGALAAAGKMFAGAGEYLGEKRTKRTVGENDSYFTSRIESQRTKAEELRQQAEDVDLTGGFKPMEAPTINIPGVTDTSSDSSATTVTTPASGLSAAQRTGLKAIRDVESGHFGYEAYNLGGKTEFDPVGSGSATDNRFGKPLTQMTIGEIKKLGASGQIHATGAYQFTHNTGSFGEAASFAGLSDNDYFTASNQDAMALAFGQKYGWERWSGLKKDPERARLAQVGFQ